MKVFVYAVLCKLSCIYSERDIIVYIFFIPRHAFWLLDINEDNGTNIVKVYCRR